MNRKLWSNDRWELWSNGLSSREYDYFIPMVQLRDLYEGHEGRLVSRWILHMAEKTWVSNNIYDFVEAYEQGLKFVEGNEIDVASSLRLHEENKRSREERYLNRLSVTGKVIEFT